MNTKTLQKELFEDLIGQSSAISILESVIKKNQLAPAYLFTGPHGVGRRLAALRFLEGLLSEGQVSNRNRRRLETYNHPDLLWIEPTYTSQGKLVPKSKAKEDGVKHRHPPQIRLEQIRSLTRFLGRQPVDANLGMVVIEDVESMAEAAANALLKTLEEPGNGLLILITARPEKLLSTIRSRCQKIPFKHLGSESLQKVCNKVQKADQPNIELSSLHKHQELLNMASGSPGLLIENLKFWKEIPDELWPCLTDIPKESIEALSLARKITDLLDVEQQIWLINWLQQHLWLKQYQYQQIKRLERLRSQLLCFVQPRLAWEIALLEINA